MADDETIRAVKSRKLIAKAIDVCGSQVGLAKKMGVSRQAVSKLLRTGGVSVERARAIELATNGQVKASELRPDFYRSL